MDELELRVAWQGHVASDQVAGSRPLFESVLAYHRAPTRHYHTIRHIRWVIRHCRSIASQPSVALPAEQFDRVIAAAFFHDAIYDATRRDNEAASAKLAYRELVEIGWSTVAAKHVAAMIVATAHVPATTNSVDTAAAEHDLATAILLAADLGILAAAPAKYNDYATQVKREYAHLAPEQWRAGRQAMLRGLVELDHLYDPRVAPPGWETAARANLSAELAALSRQPEDHSENHKP